MSSTSSREDIVATTSRGPEIALTDTREQTILEPLTPETPVNPAQTVGLFRVERRLAKFELVELLKGDGFTVKKLQMVIDRFNFCNNSFVFAELGSEEEAKRLVEQWGNLTSLHKYMGGVQHIKPDFVWSRLPSETREICPTSKPRFFIPQGSTTRDALRPLEEGRRMMLSVKTPGWFPKLRVGEAREKNFEVIGRLLSKHGIEAISGHAPFYGDMQQMPRLLCMMDFETKEGAEKASLEIHDTVVEGRLTWLRPAEPAPWRVHQYAKYDPEYVAELQEKGLVTKETYEDKFVNPLPKKKKQAESGESKAELSETKASD
ncbi:hypothetical protein Ptr902_04717 [Pyrenophora tritici-repentis]|nr:hypothetical protein Ptr902_13793 [Pyrenophora tritici-repentis]KAI2485777.1 hypothetical protein Ptr902_04717 [Pyrenophora tritici-repentis]